MNSPRHGAGLGPVLAIALGGAALLGFAVVARDAAAPTLPAIDAAVQGWVLAHQQPLLHRIFLAVTTLGGIMGMRVLAVFGALYLACRGLRGVAALALLVPVGADALFNAVKGHYARPRPLGLGNGVDSSYSFPSGHATISAAVCCSLAYLLWREGYIPGGAALGAAIGLPLLVGISRLYLNVHWATDVLGGWCAGIVVATVAAILYDLLRRRPAPANSLSS